MMTGWKQRLLAAIEADGRSDRAISLAADLGPNFVNELRNTEKEPSVKKVLKLADELNVSLTHLFIGDNTTREDEEFLRLLRQSSDAERAGFLALLRARNQNGKK